MMLRFCIPGDYHSINQALQLFAGAAGLNRPGFTGDRLVLLKRLYRVCSCLHRMPPQLRLV